MLLNQIFSPEDLWFRNNFIIEHVPNFKCNILVVALKGLLVILTLNIIYLCISEESYVRPKSQRHGVGLRSTGATEIPE